MLPSWPSSAPKILSRIQLLWTNAVCCRHPKKNIFQHEVYLAIAGCLLDRSEGIDDAR